MNIQLYNKEKVRVYQGSDWLTSTFIDVGCPDKSYKTLVADFYGFDNYIEIRKKENYVRVYQFQKKSYKKEFDFGWWKDAEVIFSYNKNGKDKE